MHEVTVFVACSWAVLSSMRSRHSIFWVKKSWETCSASCQKLQQAAIRASRTGAPAPFPSTEYNPLREDESGAWMSPRQVATQDTTEGFKFGVIADVQHADMDTGYNYWRTVKRNYRHTLCALNRAVLSWNAVPGGLAFIVQLGDLIDGFNAEKHLNQSRQALHKVSLVLGRCTATKEIHHLVGNHDLYNFTRKHVYDAPTANMRQTYSYHVFNPHPGWTFIALDPFEVGVCGYDDGHPNAVSGWDILRKNNVNDCTGNSSWLEGMRGLDRRFLPYNGGIGPEQLAWLRAELREAHAKGHKVVVMSHLPIYPAASGADCLVWNYDEVLDAIYSFEPGLVVACFAGHDHGGGYAMDEYGIHHVTMESPLEVEPPEACHGVVQVLPSCLVLWGSGKVKSMAMRRFDFGKEGTREEVQGIVRAQRASLARTWHKKTKYSLEDCEKAVEACAGASDAIECWLQDHGQA